MTQAGVIKALYFCIGCCLALPGPLHAEDLIVANISVAQLAAAGEQARLGRSAAPSAPAAEAPLIGRQWMVNGLKRVALLHIPPSVKTTATPVVFAFHGHSGNALQAARWFHIHQLWPEALVVYMEGVPTPNKLVDPEGKRNGWQVRAGDYGDRDLHFFDDVLKSLRNDYHIDDARIFATGHSNGGVFTYFLWAQRGDVFAAVAPSAAIAGPENFALLKPKPVLHAAGRKDDLIKFEWQQNLISRLIQLNGCPPEGQKISPIVTRYAPARPADGQILVVKWHRR